jgi:cytoskeletal protein RodZ
MSLINDALKRARDADRTRGSNPPAMSMKAVEPAEAKSNPRSKWLVVAFVIVALGLSLWSFFRWANTTPPPSGNQLASAPQTSVPLASPTPPAPLEEPVASTNPSPEPMAIAEATNPSPAVTHGEPESLPAATPAQVVSAEPPTNIQTNDASGVNPAIPPNAAPEFRLQSIIYRQRNPTVIINGQFLEEGASIAGAEILKIERDQVTLRRMETNLVLQMPRY